MRGGREQILATRDVLGTDRAGRMILAVAADDWLFDGLAGFGADLEDNEPDPVEADNPRRTGKHQLTRHRWVQSRTTARPSPSSTMNAFATSPPDSPRSPQVATSGAATPLRRTVIPPLIPEPCSQAGDPRRDSSPNPRRRRRRGSRPV